MQVQEELQAYDDINVTPMLDLAYVLLVIFIIMTTAAVQGVRVDLPKTKVSASLAKPGTKSHAQHDRRGEIAEEAASQRLRPMCASRVHVPASRART